jgi:alanine dehydrogenase
MGDILVLSASDIRELLSMRDIIGAVEDSFRAYGTGASKLAPIILTLVDKYDGEHEIKSGYIDNYCIGTKVLTYYKDNQARYGLPTLSGIVVLHNLRDGRALAILDGSYITATRTGAAGAVAAKYLARKDSRKVGVIGAGTQGRFQVAGLSEIFGIEWVRIYDIKPENAANCVTEMKAHYAFNVEQVDSPRQAVQGADIVVTVTPSTKPHTRNEWIGEGVHINAIGADSPGKQELDTAIVTRAKVVVDNVSQCLERGEIQTAVRLGLLKRENIHAELSDVILGRRPGRLDEREITLFDATGMALQDITTAYTVYQLAVKRGLGVTCGLD